MKALKITPKGLIQEIDINKKDIIHKYNIHNRNLRPVFTRKEFSVIMSRGDCIIVSIRSVRILLGTDQVLVFNLEKQKIKDYFIPFLLEKIKNTPKDESTLFEHLVIEITFLYILEKFQRRFDEIERTSEQLLGKLNEKKLHDQTFEQLLYVKKRLSSLATHLTEVEEELTELLDDEEDLKSFYLKNKSQNIKDDDFDCEDIESILENMLELVEDISHRSRELESNIEDAQEILTLKMNNIRNMVIKFDLFLTAIAGFFTFLAVVTGVYGMNLTNHLEKDSTAFFFVIGCMALFFLLGFGFLAFWMRKKNII